MSRHNRRRIRGGHKTSSGLPFHPNTFETPRESSATPSNHLLLTPPNQSLSRRNSLTARHWHNRYLAWQVRERKQREECEKLEAEKKRIFGDDSVEADDGLCFRMLEYFGGLDFIDG